VDRKHRAAEQDRGEGQKIDRAKRGGEPGRERRSRDGAGGAAGGDETEEPARLLVREEVHHEAPEHRDHEEVEHAHPNEERARDGRVRSKARLKEHVESEDIGGEEPVDDRQEAAARETRRECPEERDDDEHREESACEHPGQVLHPAGNPHLVAQRPQHVVAGEQAEEIDEREPKRAPLVAFDLHQLPPPIGHDRRSLISSTRGGPRARFASVPCAAEAGRAVAPTPPPQRAQAMFRRRCGAHPKTESSAWRANA
jgi:hypothetical protein